MRSYSPCLFWKVYRVLPFFFFAFKNKLFIALCLMGGAKQMVVFIGGIILLLCLHAQWEQMLHSLKNPFYKIARYQYYWFWGLSIYVLHVMSYVCICMWDVCVSWSPEAPFLIFFSPVRSERKVYRFCDPISWQALLSNHGILPESLRRNSSQVVYDNQGNWGNFCRNRTDILS